MLSAKPGGQTLMPETKERLAGKTASDAAR
jgi:hypothetical protein